MMVSAYTGQAQGWGGEQSWLAPGQGMLSSWVGSSNRVSMPGRAPDKRGGTRAPSQSPCGASAP